MSPAPLVRLAGGVAVRTADGTRPVPGRLDREVLVHLVLARGRPVAVELLVDTLWPEHPPAGATNALQVKVSRLRGLLGEEAGRLQWSQGAYSLRLQSEETDTGQLEAAVRRAEECLRAGDPDLAVPVLAAALGAWRGSPLTDVAQQPAVVAERVRLEELHATACEACAEARLRDPATRSTALADLRHLLESMPLRPRARRLLMEALDLSGRRADALAVYDAGRRLLLQTAGLEPPEELRATFERMLDDERRATRRSTALDRSPGAPPEGVHETSRWLADAGDVDGGLALAVRGAWWWWFGGRRGPAQELLEDLLGRSAEAGVPDGAVQLTARVWVGVFSSTSARAAIGLADADAVLRRDGRPPWSRHDALAAVLVAERLLERGDPRPAHRLLRLALRHYDLRDDAWGRAMCGTVLARGRLQAGDIHAARRLAAQRLTDFVALTDPAGQLMALDLLGTCAEIHGDLDEARTVHEQALLLARRTDSPDWEAAQLTRLGNVSTLAGRSAGVGDLEAAAQLSEEIGSATVTALTRNGLGLALEQTGDPEAATAQHTAAWTYYESARSSAGLAYTGARLGALAATSGTPGPDGRPAASWASESLRHALTSSDPRATALSLESFTLATDDDASAVRALAAADRLRDRTGALLPPSQRTPIRARAERLRRETGRRFTTLSAEGAADPVGTAQALAR